MLHNCQSKRATGRIVAGGLLLALSFGLHAQSVRPEIASRSIAGTEAGVVDSAGAVVGPLVDVLVDRDGKTLAGVIDVGGFWASACAVSR